MRHRARATAAAGCGCCAPQAAARHVRVQARGAAAPPRRAMCKEPCGRSSDTRCNSPCRRPMGRSRSDEHTSELQSLMRSSYAVFCLKNKKSTKENQPHKLVQAHEQNPSNTKLTKRDLVST